MAESPNRFDLLASCFICNAGLLDEAHGDASLRADVDEHGWRAAILQVAIET